MKQPSILGREPILFYGLVQTILALILAFGPETLSTEQTGAILAVTAAVLALVTRRKVGPT